MMKMKSGISIFLFFISLALIPLPVGAASGVDREELEFLEISLQAPTDIFPKSQIDVDKARYWYQYFTGPGKNALRRHLNRAQMLKGLIDSILDEHEVPRDLFYLGLVESGYSFVAESRAAAVGPWQFIKSTGEKYGLKIDMDIDERKSIIKSTAAAARYLKDLYHIFNDWTLASAAYNMGEYGILNAIRKGNSRSYKVLCQKKLLPEETRDYVAKIWVVRALVETVGEFKLNRLFTETGITFSDLQKITLSGKFSFSDLAKKYKTDESTLRSLNRDILLAEGDFNKMGAVDFYLPKVE